jgi:hypothetical protein
MPQMIEHIKQAFRSKDIEHALGRHRVQKLQADSSIAPI